MKQLSDYEYYRTELGVLYCGDCLEILPFVPDNSVDMILTDPPYGISFLPIWKNNHARLKNDDFETWLSQMPLWLKEFKRVVSNTGCCCCCCGGGGGKIPVTPLFTLEAIKHFNLIQTLVWRKNMGVGWRYRPAYENIVILSKDKEKYNFYDTSNSCSNVIEGIHKVLPSAEDHPTTKPVKLMEHLLKIHSQADMLVLDPFCGGGSTAVACEKLNRRWIGIEISEKYCKITKKRLEQETNQMKLFK